MTPAMRLGQRRLSSRWKRRGAARRAASRSFNAPQSKPDGRTVCPSSPAASSHGACPRRRAIARHNSTTTAVSSRVRSWTSSTTTRSKSANPSGSSPSRSRPTAAVAAASSGKMLSIASGPTCSATLSSALAAARPTPSSPARRSRYVASLSRTKPPVGMESVSPGTARPSSIARTSACSAASRSVHGPACRRPSREVAAANRTRLFDNVSRSTSAPHTSPRNVAKSRASTRTSAGANAWKCSSAAAVSSRDHVRYSTRWPLRASTAFHRTVVFPDPGRPWTRRTGPSCRMNCNWSAVQGRPTRSASSISCCENGR